MINLKVEVDNINIKYRNFDIFFSNQKIEILYNKLLYAKRESDKVVS